MVHYNINMLRRAFTLIELLVVIAIIGLLSTVAAIATTSAQINSRNTARKANLAQIAKALELYYTINGGYPLSGGWAGNCAGYGGRADSGAAGWIPNLAPGYIGVLPHDPNTGVMKNLYCISQGVVANRACYLYMSNGIDYKALAFCTPEGPTANIVTDPMVDTGAEANGYAYSVYTPGAVTW